MCRYILWWSFWRNYMVNTYSKIWRFVFWCHKNISSRPVIGLGLHRHRHLNCRTSTNATDGYRQACRWSEEWGTVARFHPVRWNARSPMKQQAAHGQQYFQDNHHAADISQNRTEKLLTPKCHQASFYSGSNDGDRESASSKKIRIQ